MLLKLDQHAYIEDSKRVLKGGSTDADGVREALRGSRVGGSCFLFFSPSSIIIAAPELGIFESSSISFSTFGSTLVSSPSLSASLSNPLVVPLSSSLARDRVPDLRRCLCSRTINRHVVSIWNMH